MNAGRAWVAQDIMDTRRLNVLFLSFIHSSRITTTTWTWQRPTVPCSLLVMWVYFFSMLKLLFDQAKILPDSKCSQAEWRKCTFNISKLALWLCFLNTSQCHRLIRKCGLVNSKQWTAVSKRLCPVFQTVRFIKNEVNSCLNFSHRKQYHCPKCCQSWGPHQTISFHQDELSSAFTANSNFWELMLMWSNCLHCTLWDKVIYQKYVLCWNKAVCCTGALKEKKRKFSGPESWGIQ